MYGQWRCIPQWNASHFRFRLSIYWFCMWAVVRFIGGITYPDICKWRLCPIFSFTCPRWSLWWCMPDNLFIISYMNCGARHSGMHCTSGSDYPRTMWCIPAYKNQPDLFCPVCPLSLWSVLRQLYTHYYLLGIFTFLMLVYLAHYGYTLFGLDFDNPHLLKS